MKRVALKIFWIMLLGVVGIYCGLSVSSPHKEIIYMLLMIALSISMFSRWGE